MTIRTPSDLVITAREVNIDFESALKNNPDWHSNDRVISHFFSAMQATFPEGERFFIDAARDVRDSHKDKLSPELKKQIQLFIQQEALHGKAHDGWCQALINLGYDKLVDFDQELKDLRIEAKEKVPAMVRLSITAAVEHYTASLAHLFLRKSELLEGASKPFKYIMVYHSLEEVEHKAVCYDLYKEANGGYFLRMFGLALATVDIAYQARKRHIYLLKKDKLWNFSNRLKAWKFVWGWDGIVMNLVPYSLRYVKPSFHPWDTDERESLDRLYKQDLAEVGLSVYPQTAVRGAA